MNGDMVNSPVSLNERTTVPLWGLIVAIPTICTAVLAFGFTSWQNFANTRAIEKQEAKLEYLERSDKEQDKQILTLSGDIRSELVEIKTTLKERRGRQ